MEQEGKQSYMQRYAAQLSCINDGLERNKRKGTLIRNGMWALDLTIIIAFFICGPEHIPEDKQNALIYLMIGLAIIPKWLSKWLIDGSNTDYKSNIIKAITAEEHPEAEYTHPAGVFNTDTLAYTYGRHLESKHEDCFRGTAHGLEFRCCECLIRTGGRNPETKFSGYVWRIDMGRELTSQAIHYTSDPINMGIIHRLKSLHEEKDCYTYARKHTDSFLRIPHELWQAALAVARKHKGDLTMVAEGKYLYIAIRCADNLFEIGRTVTEESLAKAARDIAYVVTLPSLLPLHLLSTTPETITQAP